MKIKRILSIALGACLLTGCAGGTDHPTASTGALADFTMPGNQLETLAGEVPFANFTIDAEGHCGPPATVAPTTGANETLPSLESQVPETPVTIIPQTVPTEPVPEQPPTEAEPVAPPSEVIPQTVPTEPEVVNPQWPMHIVMIDPGHGGKFPGAYYNNHIEKDMSLKVGLAIRDFLMEHYSDVCVYLTRETDVEFDADSKLDLEERVRRAVNVGAECLVSLHFNSDGMSHQSRGCLTFVSKQSWVAERSVVLSQCILNQLSLLGLANLGPATRDSDTYFDELGVPMDYYAINRHCASFGIPGIIVEHAFMDNPAEESFFGTDEALKMLARADALGIAQYLGLHEK